MMMNRFFVRPLIVVAMLLLATAAAAQSQHTAHTFALDDPENPPAATLADASMLIGSWQGEAFGGTFEETWNPPSAGSMVGLFKLMHDDGVTLYEIMLLAEEEGTLALKVKHFDADFSAWEDKQDFVRFPFVKVEQDAIHFSGVSFYRIGDNEMLAYLVMRNGDSIREEKLVYHRSDAADK